MQLRAVWHACGAGLLLGVGSACTSPEPFTFSGVLGTETEMTLVSNVPETRFRVREQGVDLAADEGWEEVGTGQRVAVELSESTRWEVSAWAPGYEELRIRLTEPLPLYEFRFLAAHRAAGNAQPPPAPLRKRSERNRRPPSEPEFADAGGAVIGLDAIQGVRFGSYHALVIGNNDYRNLPRLLTAEADADAIAQVLRDQYGFQVELVKNASRSDVIAGFERARRRLTESDNLLIYYAGHGYYDDDTSRGYWLPVDASEHTRTNWISNSDITDSLRSLQAKHVLVVADSCYSGTLTRGVSVKIRGSDYVRRMAEKRARVVITSGGLEPVEDGGGSGHSVFAKALLDALRANDGLLDGTSLFAKIRRPVVLNSPQTPEYGDIRFTGHEGGDFLFVPTR